MGFYPPEAIVKPERLLRNLSGQSPAVFEYHLKVSSERILRMNAVSYYNDLLKCLVPDWNIVLQKSCFLSKPGNGIGESSLVTFRKVTVSGRLLFEKVYLKSYPDYSNTVFFQSHIYRIISEEIEVPLIVMEYSSELIDIVYFEYKHLSDFPSKQISIFNLIAISKILYRKSCENSNILNYFPKSLDLYNYTRHFEYNKYYEKAHLRLSANGCDVKRIHQSVNSSMRVITHGDLNITNIYSPNIVIDWDTFGIFPMGFDVAFLYCRLLWDRDFKTDFLFWLHNNYFDEVRADHWKQFEINSCYFVYVFCTLYFDEEYYTALETNLLSQLSI